MDNISAIIIDDEKHARESLSALLKLYCPTVNLMGSASNIAEGNRIINKINPDVVFLDIEIGKNSGFDLLEDLIPFKFQLIFVTGHSEFALKAFQVNAVDYLLKPIEPGNLIKAVEKAKKMMGTAIFKNQFTNLLQSFKSEKIERISIPSRTDGISILEVQKIIFIEGSGPYSTFFSSDGQKIMASKNLGHFQSLLPEKDFYRTHQSYLVNINFISRVIPQDGLVELSTGAQIPVAKGRKDELINRFV